MKVTKLLAIGILATSFYGCGFEIVDPGHRGVRVSLGEVENKSLPEGIYFYNPFTSDIKEMNVQEQKFEVKTMSYSKDVQRIDIVCTLNYYPEREKMHLFYKNFGYDFATKIIPQVVEGVTKAVIGQYDAVTLISERQKAVDVMSKELTTVLASRDIHITRFEVTNFDYDDKFEKAVEEKVVAIQQAEQAKNITVRIQEEAKQTMISAEASAKSMKIRADALAQNKSLVEYEAVQKWDGKLPTYMMGNSIPFINLSK